MIRTVLVLIVVAFLLLVLAAMAWGWRRRRVRQDVLLPGLDLTPPADLDRTDVVVPPASGLYVGSTFSDSWQDRVVVGGLGRRAAATATLLRAGALFERRGDADVFLPWAVIDGARVEPALAGKVLGKGGLLVVRWHHVNDDGTGHQVDTGFRADDRRTYLDWVTALDFGGGLEPPPTVDPDPAPSADLDKQELERP